MIKYGVWLGWVLLAFGCGGGSPPQSAADATPQSTDSQSTQDSGTDGTGKATATQENEFQLSDSDTAGAAHGASASKLKPTKTEAVLKFFVIDKKEDKPVKGVVISLTSADGGKFYAEETDEAGYAEVLVPVGQKYALTYLSLGKRDIKASVPVNEDPMQNIKLTLRYENKIPPKESKDGTPRGFILGGVTFDTGKATIRPESFPRLDSVVEFMAHKKSARVQIAGHTDNVGVPSNNKQLSLKRAQACRQYLIDKGIDASRIEAVGFGDEQPVATNESEEGRQRNRRIEAYEL